MASSMDSESSVGITTEEPQCSSSPVPTQAAVTTSSLDSFHGDDYLENKNLQFVSSLAPTVTYIVFVMLSGLVGNTFVFCVYYRRFKPSVTRTYILAMSVCDLMTNMLSLPADLVEVRFHSTFHYSWACKLIRTVKSFLSLLSSFILVAVAFDRQRTICSSGSTPLTVRHARVVVVLVAVGAMAFTLPYTVLTGRKTYRYTDSNITAVECSIDDVYSKSRFLFIYNLVLGSLFCVCVILMVVWYTRIVRHLWLHKKKTVSITGMAFDARKRSKKSSMTSSSHTYTVEGSSEARSQQQSVRIKDGQGGNGPDSTDTDPHLHDNKMKNTSPGTAIPLVESLDETGASSCEDTTDDLPLQTNHRPTDTKNNSDMLTDGDSHESVEDRVTSVSNRHSTARDTNVDDDVTTTVVTKQRGHTSSRSRSILSNIRQTASDVMSFVTGKMATTAKRRGSVRRISNRTTIMMFVLTVTFIINYLPYVVIVSMRSVMSMEPVLDSLGLNGYHVALRSYFINSAINPLVYSFCSARFRQECRRLCRVKAQ